MTESEELSTALGLAGANRALATAIERAMRAEVRCGELEIELNESAREITRLRSLLASAPSSRAGPTTSGTNSRSAPQFSSGKRGGVASKPKRRRSA